MAYGAADPTIVRMAYASGMANVPADTSASMTAIRDAYKSRMDNIEGIFKKIEEKNELTAAELEDQLKPLMDTIADGTFTSDVVDATAGHLSDFRTAWKAIPKGQEGEADRLKWRSELNKYTKGLEAEGAILSSTAGMVGSGEYNVQATGSPDMQFLGTIANYYNKKEGSNMARREIEGNEVVYYATIDGQEVRKTQSELKDLVVTKDPEMQQKIEKLLHNQKVNGTTLGVEYDANTFNNSVEKIIGNSKNTYADFINTKFAGMNRTVKQELHSRDGLLTEDIFGVLTELGLDEYDIDGGGISESDFAGEEGDANFFKLTDALTNHKSKNFNFRTAKLIAGTVLAAGEGRKMYDAGKTMFNASKYKRGSGYGGGGGDTDGEDGGHVGSSMGGVGWVPGSKKQEYRGYIDKFADFQGNYGNYKFDKGEGKYYDANAEEKVFMTPYEVAQKEDAAKGDSAEMFKYNVEDLDENKPLNMVGEPVEGGVFGNFFQQDDDDALASLKKKFPSSFTFEETGMFGWGKGIQIFHPTKGSLGTYYFRRDAGQEADDQAKEFNSNMAQHFVGASSGGTGSKYKIKKKKGE